MHMYIPKSSLPSLYSVTYSMLSKHIGKYLKFEKSLKFE